MYNKLCAHHNPNPTRCPLVDLISFRFLYAAHRVNKLEDDWIAVMGEVPDEAAAAGSEAAAAPMRGGSRRLGARGLASPRFSYDIVTPRPRPDS